MENILAWIEETNILETESCFAINFGYKGFIPLPQVNQKYLFKYLFYSNLTEFQVSIKPEEEPILFDLSSSGLAFPGDCSFVIISKEYFRKFDKVSNTLENIIPIMKATPLAIFVDLEDFSTDNHISLTNSKLPPLVNYL